MRCRIWVLTGLEQCIAVLGQLIAMLGYISLECNSRLVSVAVCRLVLRKFLLVICKLLLVLRKFLLVICKFIADW